MPKISKQFITVSALGCLLILACANGPATETNKPADQPPAVSTGITSISTGKHSFRNHTPPVTKAIVPPKTVSSQLASHASGGYKTAAVKTGNSIITKEGKSYPLRQYHTSLTPDDPYANQWWVAPNGMETVWGLPAGSRQVKIAIIDTGFALQHEELASRWATNSGEIGATTSEAASDLNCTDQAIPLNKACNNIDDNFDGIVDNESGVTTEENPSKLNCTDQSIVLDKSCNNIDDDDNGLVDDVKGWDFANNDWSVQAGEINPTGSGTRHGTMVAGILGATGNNGVGTAGVNWNARILPIQALTDNGYGDSYTVAQALYYAADQGADVISMSLGTSSDDPYLRLAILYALDKGAVIVAASGNDGCDCISYPAAYPEVVAVGALAPDGTPASFSNYGPELDLLAPGQSITSSVYSSTNSTSAYATGSGTSFATPFVSGLLSLARSTQPNAAWEEIIGSMLENSDRRTLTVGAPHNDTLGYGVAKADSMLARIDDPLNVTQRYQFSGGAISGSDRAYQCDGTTIPATGYYELTKSGSYKYTANLRQLSKLIQAGWTERKIGDVCMGLPTDTQQALRLIDLPKETLDIQLKQ